MVPSGVAMSLRLSRITLREIKMTLREPFELSMVRTDERRVLLLMLTDSDGLTTWSESRRRVADALTRNG